MSRMFAEIKDPRGVAIISDAFREHAPLTMALIAAGLVFRVPEGPALTVMTITDEHPPPAINKSNIPLPVIHSNRADRHDYGAMRESAVLVAKKTEERIKAIFQGCRVIVAMEPQLVEAATEQHPDGARIACIITAQIRELGVECQV